MTKYEVIKTRLEALTSNRIGGNRLTITNIANEMKQHISDVSEVVTDMVNDGDLMFEKRTMTLKDKTYNIAYLEKVKKRKTIDRRNLRVR